MFCYQRNHYSQVEVINKIDEFYAVIDNDELRRKIALCREALASGDDKLYAERKRQLPMFIFQAGAVEVSTNKKGEEGLWRTQAHTFLNGLCVLDIDHIDNPAEVWENISNEHPAYANGSPLENWLILAVYITPSGHGLKVVFTADPEIGNLADNQRAFATALGVISDESIKDSSRASFAVAKEDFLFIDETNLINFFNPNYDKIYGENYRKGSSRPIKSRDKALAKEQENDKGGEQASEGESSQGEGRSEESLDVKDDELMYGSIPVSDIAERYTRKFGSPIKGDRHRYLIKVAGHFRYLVDNNASKLKMAVRTIPWVREWEQSENNGSEIDDICRDVCTYRMWREIPKAVASVLRNSDYSGNTGANPVSESLGESIVQNDSRAIWSRLRNLLEDDPVYSLCTAHLADDNKIAGVFVAGGMFCTLASRTHYLHYDGQQHRMNPQVFVIGKPASGKSFADELDKAIMSVLRAADEPGRKAELAYKKESKKRRTSNKASKNEKQMEEPEVCIRYIPSRTSNAVFYKRQMNAKELVEGEIMPLHLYTFDSELDSSVTAQSGGTWIGKHDLELKAFHNEFSGVDYANSDSVNEVIQVFWNQIVTGTDVSLAKKINLRNVNDGLCSRIAICRIASDDYTMIAHGNYDERLKQMEQLKQWGVEFDNLRGEIIIPKLVEHCYKLCEKAAKSAAVKQDRVLDYFRKRAVFYAEWFTIPRIIGRAIAQMKAGKEGINIMKPQVKQSDLDFAELIFDTIIYYQDVFFGSMLEEVWQNAQNSFVVRRQTRTTRNEELFSTLPESFNLENVRTTLGGTLGASRMQVRRWEQNGLIKRIDKQTWKKI